MAVRLLQPSKASLPSDVRPVGILIDVRFSQFWKACDSMAVIDSGNTTFDRFLAPAKRPLGSVLASVFKVRGNVRVTGNTGNGKVSNVLLNGKPIAVTGVLAGTASIGVTGDEFDQVTSGLSAHGGNIGAFFSDDVSRNYIGWNEEHTDAVLIDSVPHMSGGYGGIPVDVNYGDVAVFSASATGYELTYQWQYSKDNGTTWNNLTGKTAATLTVKASPVGTGVGAGVGVGVGAAPTR